MAFVVSDRTSDTTTSVGPTAFTISGTAPNGYQTFLAGIGVGNTTYLTITDGTNWMDVLATVTSSTLITVTQVLSGTAGFTISSNFTATGVTKQVFCSYPAPKAVIQDPNGIVNLNNYAPAINSIASAGATTNLTAASANIQRVTGTLAQTIKLPDQTTLPTNGVAFVIDNNSTQSVTITDSAGTTLATAVSNATILLYSTSNSAATGNWDGFAHLPIGVQWGSGALGVPYGGTGITSLALGYIPYGNGTGALSSSANLFFDGTNLGIGFSSPSTYGKLAVNGNGYFNGTFISIGGAAFYKSANVTVNNGLSLGTVSKSVAPLGGTGQFAVLSDDATNQLQGVMALITDPTTANRRFQFYCIEQNVAYRNITFQEVGGNVGIGTAIPSKKLDVLTEMGYVTSTSAAQNDYLTFGAGGTLANAQGSTWNIRRGYDNVSLVTLDGNGNFYNALGADWQYSPAPTALVAGANAVTAAQLKGNLFTCVATAAVTMTLPTGTAIDTGFPSVPTTNISLDFIVQNNGTSAGVITVALGTGITNGGIAGNLTIAIGTFATFRLRRTAANTYTLYRLG